MTETSWQSKCHRLSERISYLQAEVAHLQAELAFERQTSENARDILLERIQTLEAILTEIEDWEALYPDLSAWDLVHKFHDLAEKILAGREPDSLWCPRCGRRFHDINVMAEPEQYWQCPLCHVWQHQVCRNLPSNAEVEVLLQLSADLGKQSRAEIIHMLETDTVRLLDLATITCVIIGLREILEEVHGDCDRDIIETATLAALQALGVEARSEG